MSDETFIFFDVDGVLINGFHADPEIRQRWDRDLEQDLGIISADLEREFFHKVFPEVVIGKQDLAPALARVLPEIGFRDDPKILIDYWLERDSHINDDVLKAAKRLAEAPHLRLFIATGQEHIRARYLWETLGFQHYFEDIFYTARMGHHKHTPEFFQSIEDALGLPKDQKPACLLIDDSPKVLDAAKAAGWETCQFKALTDLEQHPLAKEYLAQ